MAQDAEKSSNLNHVNELRQRENEFDSVLDVIKTSNIDPYKICSKRIIGEVPIRDIEFDATEKFKEYLATICNKEINGDFVDFDFNLLDKCCKDIINANHGSINFDKGMISLILLY